MTHQNGDNQEFRLSQAVAELQRVFNKGLATGLILEPAHCQALSEQLGRIHVSMLHYERLDELHTEMLESSMRLQQQRAAELTLAVEPEGGVQ